MHKKAGIIAHLNFISHHLPIFMEPHPHETFSDIDQIYILSNNSKFLLWLSLRLWELMILPICSHCVFSLLLKLMLPLLQGADAENRKWKEASLQISHYLIFILVSWINKILGKRLLEICTFLHLLFILLSFLQIKSMCCDE